MLTHRACLTNVVQMLPAAPVVYTDPGHAAPLGVTGFLAAPQDHHITRSVVVPPIVQALAKHPAAPRLAAAG